MTRANWFTWLVVAAVIILAGVVFTRGAKAQNPVVTMPYTAQGQLSTTNSSGSVAVTNTFQSIFAASTVVTGRVACTVQNTGTNAMYVFFGPIASATTATSVKLTAGQSVNCNVGGVTLRDQVSITGTATETFYAAQQ